MALLATILACTAISAGCSGPPAAAPPPAAQRPASHFAIEFERSGGLKGSVETLVVRPGLRAHATAPKGPREASKDFKMDAATAEEVRRELAKARFAKLGGGKIPGNCADCYVYTITYHGHRVSFLANEAPNDPMLEVVDALEEEVILHLYRHVGSFRR